MFVVLQRMNMTLTEVQKLSEAAALACSANGSASNDMQGHIQGVSFFTMLSRKIDTSVIWR